MTRSTLHGILDAQTWLDLTLWSMVFLVILTGIVWLLRTEKRQFERRGKGRGWLWMRLLALPMLAVTAAVILLPASRVAGMEALGIFYIALFTLGPLTWFGLHGLLGAMQSPRFTRGESLGLAVTGLAILIVPPILVVMAQGPIFMASHRMKEAGFANADQAPLALMAMPVQRFRLGEAGEIYTQALLARPGMHIERIDSLSGSNWSNTATMMHAYMCRQGEDLYLAWSVGSRLAPLRIHWRDSNGKRFQAEYHVDGTHLANLPAQDFALGWRDDGIDLPVPLMRDVVELGWANAPDRIFYRALNPLQPGENFDNDCVMQGYQRVAWQQEGPIDAVKLRFHPVPPAEAWQAEFRRTP
jgi:hypothetical protein